VILISNPSLAYINTENNQAALEFMNSFGLNEYSMSPESTVSFGEFLKTLLISGGWSSNVTAYSDLNYVDVPPIYNGYVKKAKELGLINHTPNNNILGFNQPISVSRALELSLRFYGLSNSRFLNNPDEYTAMVSNFKPNFVLAPLIERGLNLGLLQTKNNQVKFLTPITRAELASLILNIRDVNSQILNYEFNPTPGFKVNNLENPQNISSSSSERFKILQDVYSRIKSDYVNNDQIDFNKLIYSAISTLVDGLDDPNSVFLEPKLQEAFKDNLSNQIEGIGASLTLDDNKRIVVVSPLSDSPAEKAGIMPGDIIIGINGTSTDNMSLNQAVSKIKGQAGTDVQLTVKRNGSNLNFVITRSAISSSAVSGVISSDNIGIITLRNFGLGIETTFAGYVDQIKSANVKGVILDLRNNPGGYLDSAARLAGHFLNSGEVVAKINYAGKRYDEVKSSGEGELVDIPIVVLVNKGTASASEILAAVLSEKAGAVLIGEKTFGKGTVQELITYTDDSALKLTVANWLTSKGKDINKVGLVPNINVAKSKADSKIMNDAVLNRALTEIKKM
jgi:carboxyl-terminal processing protease